MPKSPTSTTSLDRIKRSLKYMPKEIKVNDIMKYFEFTSDIDRNRITAQVSRLRASGILKTCRKDGLQTIYENTLSS